MIFFDFLYILFALITLPLWGIKVFLKKEYCQLLKHRFRPAIPYSSQKRLWLHAVSVGEVRSIRQLIEKLKELPAFQTMEIVLSVTTPTGYHYAKKEFPHITVIPSPLDFSFTIRYFIKNINPCLLILNELELWPNWISLMHRKGIPIILINGRMSTLAFNRYKRFSFLMRRFFFKLNRYLVQAPLYQERFIRLGIKPEKIMVCGNIKADEAFIGQAHLPSEKEILDTLCIENAGKPIVTIASSHALDEQFLAPVIKEMASHFYFIVVPRHLERVATLEKMLAEHQIPFTTWSKIPAGSKTSDTLILDRMGYLFSVFKVTDIVFMGGTLDRKIGGHNLYEPAVFGKPILGGPHYNNFPDIGDELRQNGVYIIVDLPQTCISWLHQWLNKGINPQQIASQAIETVAYRRGSLECTLKEIQQLIN